MNIPKGMELMIQSFIKMIGLDPVKVQSAMDNIGKSVQNAATELQTVRRQQETLIKQNAAIMAHLGIQPATGETDDGQQQQLGFNGHGGNA